MTRLRQDTSVTPLSTTFLYARAWKVYQKWRDWRNRRNRHALPQNGKGTLSRLQVVDFMGEHGVYELTSYTCGKMFEVPAGDVSKPEQVACPHCGAKLFIEWRPAE